MKIDGIIDFENELIDLINKDEVKAEEVVDGPDDDANDDDVDVIEAVTYDIINSYIDFRPILLGKKLSLKSKELKKAKTLKFNDYSLSEIIETLDKNE